MGSPLGPLFANAFMSDFENKHMRDLEKLGIKLWWRYADDVFASVESREQAERVLQFLNEKHPNIKFTIEHEQNNRLAFLDTCVVRCKGELSYNLISSTNVLWSLLKLD